MSKPIYPVEPVVTIYNQRRKIARADRHEFGVRIDEYIGDSLDDLKRFDRTLINDVCREIVGPESRINFLLDVGMSLRWIAEIGPTTRKKVAAS